MVQKAEYILELAKNAGSELNKLFLQSEKSVIDKGHFNVATQADHIAESILIQGIQNKYPEDSIYSEESGLKEIKSNLWIIDPLDGTSNFIMGLPLFGIAITYIENGKPRFSLHYFPQLATHVYGDPNNGTFINNIQIHTNTDTKDTLGVVSLVAGYGTSDLFSQVYPVINANVKRTLCLWCPSFDACLISKGDIDAIVYLNNEIEDALPGLIAAKSAGCQIKTMTGEDYQFSAFSTHLPSLIVARNNEIFSKLSHLLQDVSFSDTNPDYA